jgi:hypothetical protein
VKIVSRVSVHESGTLTSELTLDTSVLGDQMSVMKAYGDESDVEVEWSLWGTIRDGDHSSVALYRQS